MRLEWSAEGETRRGNVESGRKTDYQILSHVWNEDFHTHSKMPSKQKWGKSPGRESNHWGDRMGVNEQITVII